MGLARTEARARTHGYWPRSPPPGTTAERTRGGNPRGRTSGGRGPARLNPLRQPARPDQRGEQAGKVGSAGRNAVAAGFAELGHQGGRICRANTPVRLAQRCDKPDAGGLVCVGPAPSPVSSSGGGSRSHDADRVRRASERTTLSVVAIRGVVRARTPDPLGLWHASREGGKPHPGSRGCGSGRRPRRTRGLRPPSHRPLTRGRPPPSPPRNGERRGPGFRPIRALLRLRVPAAWRAWARCGVVWISTFRRPEAWGEPGLPSP